MAQIKFANVDFEAVPAGFYNYLYGSSDSYYSETLRRIQLEKKKFKWFCDGQKYKPAPIDTAFKAVEPHLMVYKNTPPKGKTHNQIDLESAEAGKEFLRVMGFAGPEALLAALIDEYGAPDVPIDLDAAIAKLKAKFRLSVKVQLLFYHVELSNPKIVPGARIVLSLPHEVVIRAKKTKECTPEGVLDLWGTRKFKIMSHTLVRAEKDAAFKVRKISTDLEISGDEAHMDAIKARIAQAKQKQEAMKPKAD
ncbi:MAG: hypothetical protein WA790_16180 [Sulfitobacter sp.]